MRLCCPCRQRVWTTGEISAHFRDIYGASVSKETVSRITDKVVAEMEQWSSRPLDPVYVAIFLDAIVVTVREGQVGNRPVYAVIGVTLERRKDVLGLTMGTGGGEGAKFSDGRAHRPEKSWRARRVFPRL
jgi:putative transposase